MSCLFWSFNDQFWFRNLSEKLQAFFFFFYVTGNPITFLVILVEKKKVLNGVRGLTEFFLRYFPPPFPPVFITHKYVYNLSYRRKFLFCASAKCRNSFGGERQGEKRRGEFFNINLMRWACFVNIGKRGLRVFLPISINHGLYHFSFEPSLRMESNWWAELRDSHETKLEKWPSCHDQK